MHSIRFGRRFFKRVPMSDKVRGSLYAPCALGTRALNVRVPRGFRFTVHRRRHDRLRPFSSGRPKVSFLLLSARRPMARPSRSRRVTVVFRVRAVAWPQVECTHAAH